MLACAMLLAHHNEVAALDQVAENVAFINQGKSAITESELEYSLAHKSPI
ncbi:MAG: hypothetical protein ACRC2U_13800 [Aeromonas sp.]|jgi:UDP-glucose 6-dehydrogenase